MALWNGAAVDWWRRRLADPWIGTSRPVIYTLAMNHGYW